MGPDCSPGPARSPVLLGVVHDGPDLQLPVDLRPPILLQLHLLERKGPAVSPSAPVGSHLPRTSAERKGGSPGPLQVRCLWTQMAEPGDASRRLLAWVQVGAGEDGGDGGTGPAPAMLREQGAIDGLGRGNRPPLCGAQSRAPVRRARRPTLGSQAEENKRGLSEGGRLPVQTPSGLPGCRLACLSPCSDSEKARLDACPAWLAKKPPVGTGKGRRECSSTRTGRGPWCHDGQSSADVWVV